MFTYRQKIFGLLVGFLLGCVQRVPAESDIQTPARLRVLMLVFEGMNLLDYAGPREVFEAASGVATYFGDPDPFEVTTVAVRSRDIATLDGTRLRADTSLSQELVADIVVVPGGLLQSIPRGSLLNTWLRQQAKMGTMVSVCSGALALAEAGLLRHQEAVTHHMAQARLHELSPTTTVRVDRRYIDNGRILTTAGVTAGIDGTLHLVDRLLGRKIAVATAQQVLEYPWNPDDASMQPVIMDEHD
jgi:transcriptional regulator GlxA family with amidase domain